MVNKRLWVHNNSGSRMISSNKSLLEAMLNTSNKISTTISDGRLKITFRGNEFITKDYNYLVYYFK